jgi:membrane protein
LSGLLPAEAARFLGDQLQTVAEISRLRLGAGTGGAFAVALWCARSVMATLISALNLAYNERERRPFLRLHAVTLVLTAGALPFAVAALALVALLPVVIDKLPISTTAKTALAVGRWATLALMMTLGLAALYRAAPSRPISKRQWLSGGALVATALWLLGSWGFSYYVTLTADAGTWSALTAVLALQTWFYITALAVLIGAKVNVEAENLAP